MPAAAERQRVPAASSDVRAVPHRGALERELDERLQPGGVRQSEPAVERRQPRGVGHAGAAAAVGEHGEGAQGRAVHDRALRRAVR